MTLNETSKIINSFLLYTRSRIEMKKKIYIATGKIK